MSQPSSTSHLRDEIEATIAAGHRLLRFPKWLEAQFEADNFKARKKLLLICGVIGLIGFLIGSANDPKIMPDIEAMAAPVRRGLGVLIFVSLLSVFLMPNAWRKNWHYEAMTAFNTTAVCMAIVWTASMSREVTAMAHSVCMFGLIMYAGIAARQRFRWTCATALLSFIAYVTFVRGTTPLHQALMLTNVKILAVSLTFTLLANYTFEHRERSVWLLRKLNLHRRDALVEASERLRELSMRDPLTGLFNRRQFDADLELAWSRAAFAKQSVALLSIDLDFFKLYNDSLGHPAGDACLKRVATILGDLAIQESGIAGRLGGEEFGLLLPGRSLDEAVKVGQDLCAAVRRAAIEHPASLVSQHVTASVGAAVIFPGDAGSNRLGLVAMADQALYRAKHRGRDRAESVNSLEPIESTEALEVDDIPAHSDVVHLPSSPVMTSQEIEAVLNKGLRWLRFPHMIEAAYQKHDAKARQQHLLVSGLIGLVLFNVFALSSQSMFPDIVANAQQSQLWLSVMLSGLICLIYVPIKPWLRELVYAIGTSIMGVVTVVTLSKSQLLMVYSFAVTVFLIPMFSGIAARQPFKFACLPAVATGAALVLCFKAHDEVQALILTDSIFMYFNATVYTLMAAYALEHGARKEWLLEQVESRQHEALAVATKKLHAWSMLDPLTGLCNRRQFELDFDRLWREAKSDGRPVSMLIFDIDFFKLFNDGYGHPAGDRCLQQVAHVLLLTAQQAQGIAVRLGGEEFGILLPGRSEAEAVAVGEQACQALRRAGIAHAYSKVSNHVTMSVGAACMRPHHGLNPRQLLAHADEALYQAKHAGRNQVRAHHQGESQVERLERQTAF